MIQENLNCSKHLTITVGAQFIVPGMPSAREFNTQVFADDERLAGALRDRLTHHVHVIEILAPSFRLNASIKNIKRKTAENNIDPSVGSSNEV